MAKREPPDGEPAPGLSRLPPGRHGLPRSFVTSNQRGRLAAGAIAAVVEHGYHETSVTQISAAAGVSRRTFYSYFTDKEACFLATYQLIETHLIDSMSAAAAADPDAEWPRRLRASLAALLEAFAANPDLARFFLAAPQAAGGALLARYRLALQRLLAVLTDAMPPPPGTRELSETAADGLLGGLAALILGKVKVGEGERLSELLPDLLELVLAPYLGREAAVSIAREVS